MTGRDLAAAYEEACRQLGHMHVQAAALRADLAAAHADAEEAGRRVVELTQAAEQTTAE